MSSMRRAVRKVRHLARDQKPMLFGLAGAAATALLLWATGLLGDDHSGSSGGGLAEELRDADLNHTARTGGAFDPVRCGSIGPDAWHLKYQELHRRILAGEAPQKYAVAQGWEGLADSIVGAVTVFYFALLTNRAFQMTPTNWRGNSVQYEWMYAQPFINWSPTEADDPDSFTFQLDPNNYHDWQWQDRLSCGNLSVIAEDVRTVKIITNLGYSVGIFDNPHYRDQLFQLGLRPETAYGCAYDFLLYPQPQLFEEHAAEYDVLTSPGPLKIGIQIRVGDGLQGDLPINLQTYMPFFDCAEQIQRDYQLAGQEVVWFLITDSNNIRRQAQEHFGNKLLTASPSISVGHFLNENGNTPSLRAAAMDQWLFGLADFHVISRFSGYGRTGGWRSTKWHGIYTLNNLSPAHRDCSAHGWDAVKTLAALGDDVAIGQWHPGI